MRDAIRCYPCCVARLHAVSPSFRWLLSLVAQRESVRVDVSKVVTHIAVLESTLVNTYYISVFESLEEESNSQRLLHPIVVTRGARSRMNLL